MDAESIGRSVRWARRRAGMTQADLAKAVNMPQPSIARIERGKVIPRTATLLEILRATGQQLTLEPVGPEVDREAILRRLRMNVPRRSHEALGRAARNHRSGPLHILRRLRLFAVPFVLIGPLAEAVHGAPIKVKPIVEVLHPPTDVATTRLQSALEDLDEADARRLRPLTETAAGDPYDVLLRNAARMPVDAGIEVRVAALEDLIRIRRAGRAPEDREAEAVLRAIEVESRWFR